MTRSNGVLVDVCPLTNLYNHCTCNEHLGNYPRTFILLTMQLLYNRMSIDTWEICSSQLTKALPRRLGHQHPPRWPCDRRGELPHRGAAPHVPPCPPPRWLHLVYDALQSCESRRRTTLHQKWVSRKKLNWDKFGTILNGHIQIYYQFHELELFTVINSNIIISVVKPNH